MVQDVRWVKDDNCRLLGVQSPIITILDSQQTSGSKTVRLLMRDFEDLGVAVRGSQAGRCRLFDLRGHWPAAHKKCGLECAGSATPFALQAVCRWRAFQCGKPQNCRVLLRVSASVRSTWRAVSRTVDLCAGRGVRNLDLCRQRPGGLLWRPAVELVPIAPQCAVLALPIQRRDFGRSGYQAGF